jgi:hypothetical protein
MKPGGHNTPDNDLIGNDVSFVSPHWLSSTATMTMPSAISQILASVDSLASGLLKH